MSEIARQLEGETAELLGQLIAHACVNDGTPASGQEVRNAELLAGYLDVPGIEMESYEPVPGRRSLLARLARTDPPSSPQGAAKAASPARAGRAGNPVPTLLLMGHTDVVPVEAESWQRDPFGGEVVDGWLWGRGAVDMLNLTASMAVALRHLASDSRHRPLAGDVLFLAVADEEASGIHGAKWLTEHHPEVVTADAVITESGGIPLPTSSGLRLPVVTAEKGTYWCRITVRGTPGHGSRPFHADNALATAAEVVRRLSEYRPVPQVPEAWRLFLHGLDVGEDLEAALTDPARIDEACEKIPFGLGREAHANTHTTMVPTVCHAGDKTNIIPGTAEIDVDIRSLPDQSRQDVEVMLAGALGDLADVVEITPLDVGDATASPFDTPVWECMNRVARHFYEGSAIVPMLAVGATDARYFRKLGIDSYGFGMFSRRMSIDQFVSMFHGNDERVDVESLGMSAEMWGIVARDLLG